MNYYFEIYEVNHQTGKREGLIAKGTTKELGVDHRSKTDQKNVIECKYGFGKSVYMKAIDGYPTEPKQ